MESVDSDFLERYTKESEVSTTTYEQGIVSWFYNKLWLGVQVIRGPTVEQSYFG